MMGLVMGPFVGLWLEVWMCLVSEEECAVEPMFVIRSRRGGDFGIDERK